MLEEGTVVYVDQAGSGFRKIEGYSGTIISPEDALSYEKAGTTIEGLDTNEEGVFFIEIDSSIFEDDEGENSEMDDEEREEEYDSGSIWAVRQDEETSFVVQSNEEPNNYGLNEISVTELKELVGENNFEMILVPSEQPISKSLYFDDSEVCGWLTLKQGEKEYLFYVYQRSSNAKVNEPHVYLKERLTGEELKKQLVNISEERGLDRE
ncbi:hypothetical protein [Psychrobacillus sp. FSL K6-1464]|uniref:hypothetical protein n=1 Tax=Psychrobacillus sp. FSL K6-1464 TaxID=2921545 RepID=UPI0030F5B593